MDKYEAAREWIKYSDNDLTAVNQLITHHPIQIEIVCCLCQQSAEKALKAYLVFQEVALPKTNDLNLLVAECKKFDEQFNGFLDECTRLNVYASQPIDPFGLDLSNEDMRTAIKDCNKINELVKSLMIP